MELQGKVIAVLPEKQVLTHVANGKFKNTW